MVHFYLNLLTYLFYFKATAIGGLFNVILFIRHEGFSFDSGSIVLEAQQMNNSESGEVPSIQNKQEGITETV